MSADDQHERGERIDIEAVRDEAAGALAGAVELRRTLHRWPEVGNELPITQEQVLAAIEPLPLDVTVHETTSGIAALLTGGKPGPTVLLRGDMDALPLAEDTGLEFSSRHENQMHACGHDTHTAMLVGAARLLAERAGDLAGRVLFMFQPGEEGEHGARFMLDEGLLDVPPLADGTPSPVTGAFALHITSMLPTGLADVPRRADDGVGRHPADHRSTARVGTPASRSAPSTRSRSPARSSRPCRRW